MHAPVRSHVKTLRYWFDVEALSYPDLPTKGRNHLLLYSQAMPWSAPSVPVKDDHTYFVCFGLIDKRALDAELGQRFQVGPGGESYGGNQVRDAKGRTFLCAIEVDACGMPIAASLQLAAFCIAFAGRASEQRIAYSALLAALQTKVDDLLSSWNGAGVDGHWFEQVIDFLVDALEWTPPLATSAQICVQQVSLLDRKGRRLPWTPAMDPVNSFYLDDLERILQAAENGQHAPQIGRYLGGRADVDEGDHEGDHERASTRIDVTTFDAVDEALQARRFPVGRWPTQFPLFLMQQVAVNASLRALADGGLFSVNGPPGTGKTTLLMDVIAARIVERATLLAQFGNPEQAFSRSASSIAYPASKNGISARGGSFLLDARLLDCGIVVASANNKAVENITLDLPSIGKVFPQPLQFDGAPFDYFAACAESLLDDDVAPVLRSSAQECDQADDDMADAPLMACWGLISVALGSMKNCKQVAKRLGKFGQAGLAAQLDQMAPLDWNAARLRFQSAVVKVVKLQEAIARHDALLAALRAEQDGLAGARSAFAVAQMRDQVTQGAHDGIAARLFDNERLLASNLRERDLDALEWPWWRQLFARLFRRHRWALFALQRQERDVAQDQIKDARSTLMRARIQAEADAQASKAALALQEAAVASCESEVLRLELLQGDIRAQLGAAAFDPAQFRQWPVDRQQMSLPRSNAMLQAARADVFVAAMQLHKAFLKNAGKAFETNFRLALAMLTREAYLAPHLPSMAPHLWATFFLAVPVVSTTFASMARCFRDLGEGQIGLLLVDEAGQAVPSHALGAIWRSRRALIVGDPLQVEPVLKMDGALDHGMLTWHGAPQGHLLTGHSAQHLADRANDVGAHVVQHDGSRLWVGAPLRVHRRCVEPMFSLSNAIAYNGAMVLGVPQQIEQAATLARPLLGLSHWNDMANADFAEHHSATEGAAAVAIVIAYARHGWVSSGDGLPDLFLISPFKSVADALTKTLVDCAELWARPEAGIVDEASLSAWLKERVGTVHTFQGKECETVVFVLGGKTPGARNWAGNRPNIINVAVTRAKRRLYVIGDRSSWSQTVFGAKLAQALLCPCGKPMAPELG
jgi:hypothetical protein